MSTQTLLFSACPKFITEVGEPLPLHRYANSLSLEGSSCNTCQCGELATHNIVLCLNTGVVLSTSPIASTVVTHPIPSMTASEVDELFLDALAQRQREQQPQQQIFRSVGDVSFVDDLAEAYAEQGAMWFSTTIQRTSSLNSI
jgi:hypothetical protein